MAERGICPFAVWRPLPENETQTKIRPRKILYHSAVSYGALTLWNYFNSEGKNMESHFYVRLDGVIEQYINIFVKANANVDADVDAVSIETADNGSPDTQPWNDLQLEAMVRLSRWIMSEAPDILPQIIPEPNGAGLGYHQMFMNPITGNSPWSNARFKTCPGRARIDQFPMLVDMVLSEEDEPMAKPEMLVWAAGGDGTVWTTDWKTKQKVNGSSQMNKLLYFGTSVQHENGLPFAFSQAELDAIPTVDPNKNVDVNELAAAIVAQLPEDSNLDIVLVRNAIRQELDNTKLSSL